MALSSHFDFWALLGGKMGVVATPAPKGLGLQNTTKNLAHVGVLLGHFLSQNRVPKLSDPGPLPPKTQVCIYFIICTFNF